MTQGFQTGGLASPEGVGGAIISGPNIGMVSPSKASPPVIEFDQNGNVVQFLGQPDPGADGTPRHSTGQRNAVLPNGHTRLFRRYPRQCLDCGHRGRRRCRSTRAMAATLLMSIGSKFTCDDGVGGVHPMHGNRGGNVGQTGVSHTLLNGPADIAVDSAMATSTSRMGTAITASSYSTRTAISCGRWVAWARATVNSRRRAEGIRTVSYCPTTGMVYACDRGNDRINVYQKDGTFVTAIPVITGTAALGTNGSASDIAFSPDAAQTFMYVSDGSNERTWIMNHASALAGMSTQSLVPSAMVSVTTPASSPTLDMITVDSLGNAYTAEVTAGRRQQRFVVH